MNINEFDNSLNYDLVISIAPFLGIEDVLAREIVQHVKDVVSSWRSIAAQYGISRVEQNFMSKAFNV